ncbi:hypothetical protein LCGC14_2778130, partial [marine sediment metagenome]
MPSPMNQKGTISIEELIESIELWNQKTVDQLVDENGHLWFNTCKVCNGVLAGQSRKYCSRKCSAADGTYKNNEGTKAFRRWWNNLTDEQKHDHQSHASKAANAARWAKPGAKQRASDATTVARKKKNWHTYSGRRASSGGFRSDIGISVRSRWEANIARYLNYLKKQKKIS